MRNILIIFLLSVFWSCTSCNSNDPKTDTDSAVPDKDSVAVMDSDAQDVDISVSDPDMIDADIEKSDTDTAECLPPLIEAPFPYYDKDGKITFCRSGCDSPTENDPQCASNLWKEQNQALCTQMPQYDCCGYPCALESLKPMTKNEVDEAYTLSNIPMHQCDIKLSPWNWGADGSNGVIKSWNISDGKIGHFLYSTKLSVEDWPIQFKYVTYDIKTQKYNFIAPARNQEQAYYKGNRIAMISDKRSLELNNSNIFLAYIGDDGKVEVVYNKVIAHIPYVPSLNDKWVFVNVQEPNQGSKMMYAKIGDWKWTTLRQGEGSVPAINGDNLFVTDEGYSYLCDLSKSPKSLSDCKIMNGEDEVIGPLLFDKDDGKRVVFSRRHSNAYTIVLGEKDGDSYKRTDLITDFTEATAKHAYSLVPMGLQGNILLYEEVAVVDSSGSGLLCYYRIDKKKKYCMKKMDKDEVAEDGTVFYPYGYAEFEGKWMLYQIRNNTPLILRDMECYCKEEGVCPFEQ